MEIPGLGIVTKDAQFDWYYSEPIPVPVLGAKPCRIVVAGYDEDPRKDDFHKAMIGSQSTACKLFSRMVCASIRLARTTVI
jgi:hypothetical protein